MRCFMIPIYRGFLKKKHTLTDDDRVSIDLGIQRKQKEFMVRWLPGIVDTEQKKKGGAWRWFRICDVRSGLWSEFEGWFLSASGFSVLESIFYVSSILDSRIWNRIKRYSDPWIMGPWLELWLNFRSSIFSWVFHFTAIWRAWVLQNYNDANRSFSIFYFFQGSDFRLYKTS